MKSADLRIAFRVAAGRNVGLGHLRRSATLATALQARGADVFFITSAEPGARTHVVALCPAPIELVDESLDATIDALNRRAPTLVVLDDYALSSADIERIHQRVAVAVIDDLADRRLLVDLVVNASVGAEALDYEVGPATRLLLGERYALLRDEFARVPARMPNELVRRVLVTFGGSDPAGFGPRAAAIALSLPSVDTVDLVLGPLAADVADQDPRLRIHRAPSSMSMLMAQADLAISAGGQTLLELAAMSVPTVAVAVADNQRVQLRVLAERGAVVATDIAGLPLAIRGLSAETRASMASTARALVDGHGAERVADALLSLATAPATSRG